ncbi:MAG: hypothetical protein JW779_02295, partial [Candidatus Thorarchaeota archaeon]|nr:hypothetical protein [Candidatus Thorarchaeota archaeon]
MKSRATMLIVCIFMLMISGFPMQSAVTAPSEDTSQSSSGGEPEQTTETPAPVAQPDQVFSTASESWTKDYVDSHSVTTGSVTNFNYLQNSDGVSSHWEEAPIDEDILSAHEEFVGVWDGWYEYPDNDVWSPITASGGYLTNTDFQTITFLYSPVYDLAGYETFDWSLQYTNWAGSGAFYVQWKGDDGYWRTVATLRSDALGYVIETEEILDASAHNPEDEIYFHSGFQVRLQLNPASLDMVEVHDHALTAVRYKHEFYAEFYFTGADYSQAQEYLVIDFDHPQGDEGIFIEVLNPSAEWITIDTIGAPVPIDGLRSYDISSYLTSASLSIRISDSSSRHIGYTGDIDDSYWNIDAIYLNIYTVLPDDMTPSSIVSGGYGTVTDFAYMQDSPPLDGYDAILAEVSVPVVQWTTHSSVTSFGTFPPSGYSEYSINFEQAWEGTVQYAHVTGIELSSYDGGLQSGTYSTASAQEVEVRFDTQYAGVDTGEWLVQVLATSGWVTIFQETGTNN